VVSNLVHKCNPYLLEGEGVTNLSGAKFQIQDLFLLSDQSWILCDFSKGNAFNV